MNYLMGKKCGGSRDQGFNGWGRVTVIQNTFTTVHQRGEVRTLYQGYGMRMESSVRVKKVLQPRLSPTSRTSTLLQTQSELVM